MPFANARGDDSHRAVLEQWMRSYRPEELFDPTGDVRRGDRVERQQVG